MAATYQQEPLGLLDREAEIIKTAKEIASAGFNTLWGYLGHENATWKPGEMPPMTKYMKTPKLLWWPRRKGPKTPRGGWGWE